MTYGIALFMRRRSRSEAQWLAKNCLSKQLSKKGNEKMEVAGPVVVFDAVGELTVVFVAAGAISVALREGTLSTRSRSDCCRRWARDFARRFGQNGASIHARSFDPVCFKRSAVLS